MLKKQQQALVDGQKLGELEGVLVNENQKRLELENKKELNQPKDTFTRDQHRVVQVHKGYVAEELHR